MATKKSLAQDADQSYKAFITDLGKKLGDLTKDQAVVDLATKLNETWRSLRQNIDTAEQHGAATEPTEAAPAAPAEDALPMPKSARKALAADPRTLIGATVWEAFSDGSGSRPLRVREVRLDDDGMMIRTAAGWRSEGDLFATEEEADAASQAMLARTANARKSRVRKDYSPTSKEERAFINYASDAGYSDEVVFDDGESAEFVIVEKDDVAAPSWSRGKSWLINGLGGRTSVSEMTEDEWDEWKVGAEREAAEERDEKSVKSRVRKALDQMLRQLISQAKTAMSGVVPAKRLAYELATEKLQRALALVEEHDPLSGSPMKAIAPVGDLVGGVQAVLDQVKGADDHGDRKTRVRLDRLAAMLGRALSFLSKVKSAKADTTKAGINRKITLARPVRVAWGVFLVDVSLSESDDLTWLGFDITDRDGKKMYWQGYPGESMGRFPELSTETINAVAHNVGAKALPTRDQSATTAKATPEPKRVLDGAKAALEASERFVAGRNESLASWHRGVGDKLNVVRQALRVLSQPADAYTVAITKQEVGQMLDALLREVAHAEERSAGVRTDADGLRGWIDEVRGLVTTRDQSATEADLPVARRLMLTYAADLLAGRPLPDSAPEDIRVVSQLAKATRSYELERLTQRVASGIAKPPSRKADPKAILSQIKSLAQSVASAAASFTAQYPKMTAAAEAASVADGLVVAADRANVTDLRSKLSTLGEKLGKAFGLKRKVEGALSQLQAKVKDYERLMAGGGATPAVAMSKGKKPSPVFRLNGTDANFKNRGMRLDAGLPGTVSRRLGSLDEAMAAAQKFMESNPPKGREAKVYIEEHWPDTGDSYPKAKWEAEGSEWVSATPSRKAATEPTKKLWEANDILQEWFDAHEDFEIEPTLEALLERTESVTWGDEEEDVEVLRHIADALPDDIGERLRGLADEAMMAAQDMMPQEDDVQTEDGRRFYQGGNLVAESESELRAWMEREQFWPTVWSIDDHGGVQPYRFDDAEADTEKAGYGRYGSPDPDLPSEQERRVRAHFSKLRDDEGFDAYGMARAAKVEPITAEQILNRMVEAGEAVKDGSAYFKPSADVEKASDKVGIFLKLPKDIASQFQSLGEQDDSKPHVTVLFIGDVPAEERANVEPVVREALAGVEPFEVALGESPEYFDASESSDGKRVAYVPVESPDLSAIHDRLKDALESAGIEVSATHPDYVPNATLAYLEEGREAFEGELPAGSFVADELELWGLGKPVKLKLGAEPEKAPKERSADEPEGGDEEPAEGEAEEPVEKAGDFINLGDASPLEYGGFLVDKATGEAVYWDEPEGSSEDPDEVAYEVYRFSVEDDPMADMSWMKDEDWQRAAETVGTTVEDIRALASGDIAQKAEVYRIAASLWGWQNIDSYPESFSANDMDRVFGEGIRAAGGRIPHWVGSDDSDKATMTMVMT